MAEALKKRVGDKTLVERGSAMNTTNLSRSGLALAVLVVACSATSRDPVSQFAWHSDARAQSSADQQTGDASKGAVIAKAWCAICHETPILTGPPASRPPSFKSIAERLPRNADFFAASIASPHPAMPDLKLSRENIRDLLAYIATLK